MSEDSGQYPRSPFAPSPSARPPSVDDIRMQVRVPPPSHRTGSQASITSVEPPPDLPIQPEPDLLVAPEPEPERQPEPEPDRLHMRSDESLAEPSASLPLPVASLPLPASLPSLPEAPTTLPAEAPRGRRRPLALIAAGAGGAVVLVAVVGARFMTARPEAPAVAPSASAEQASASAAPSAEPPASAASAVASAPVASANADVTAPPVASASASASASPKPVLKPFDPNQARAALNALVPKLASCKLTKGGAWSVKVTYAPDGHVVSALPAGKHSTAHNACVSTQLKQGSIDPFAGKQTPYLFKFVAGSK